MKVLCACGGGGLRGIAQVGMLTELASRGIAVDAWTGVSTGALQAGYMSQVPPSAATQAAQATALTRLWLALTQAPVSGGTIEAIARVVLGRPSLHRPNALRELISRAIGGMPLSPVELGVASLRTGAYLGLRPASVEQLRAALLASASVPGLFPPVGADAELDGGIVHVAPLKPAFALVRELWPIEEPVIILLLHCLPLDAERLPLALAPDARDWTHAPLWVLGPRVIDMLETANERADLDGARRINDVLAALALMKQQGVLVPLPSSLAGKRWVRLVQLAPTVGPGFDMLELDRPKLLAYLAAGRDAAARTLDALGPWPPATTPLLDARLASTGTFPTEMRRL